MAGGAKLHGLILDLRGNDGGATREVPRLLGAFTHGAVWTYDCDVHGSCAARYTDTDVPLLHLPLVVAMSCFSTKSRNGPRPPRVTPASFRAAAGTCHAT